MTQANIRQPETQGIRVHHRYVEDLSFYPDANLSKRLYAFLVDFIFQSTVMTLVFLPFTGTLEQWRVSPFADRYHMLSFLLTTLTFSLYTLAPLAISGQTLGKKLFGLRLVKSDYSSHMLVTQIFVREVIGKTLALALVGVGFLVGLCRDDRRFLYDVVLKTRVIQYRDIDYVKHPY